MSLEVRGGVRKLAVTGYVGLSVRASGGAGGCL